MEKGGRTPDYTLDVPDLTVAKQLQLHTHWACEKLRVYKSPRGHRIHR